MGVSILVTLYALLLVTLMFAFVNVLVVLTFTVIVNVEKKYKNAPKNTYKKKPPKYKMP